MQFTLARSLFPGVAQHQKRVHARLARAMVMRSGPGIVEHRFTLHRVR
jgi:hypothetical protein